MKSIDLDFIPSNRDGDPHFIDVTCAKFLSAELDKRISSDRPELEARIANELVNTGSCQLDETGEASELDYIRSIVQTLPIDNLLKVQLLVKFNA